MSLPALRALRRTFPGAKISILAKPWVAELYGREPFCDDLIPYTAADPPAKWAAARALCSREFDCAILLQNAFEAAAVTFAARIPERIGYARDGRGFLLTRSVPVPRLGEIPPHERFYYLELLRRAGIIDSFREDDAIRLDGAAAAKQAGIERLRALGWQQPVIGLSPGAAYGSAKRWLPERFAEAANRVAAELGAAVVIFGSKDERELCARVASAIAAPVKNFAGETPLGEFIELAAGCDVYLTNDSGAMHIASALGVPTVAIFGATNDATTGPTGCLARVVREPVECSPCLKRECPIDHRCMTRVTAEKVARVALELLK
ncbi:MAG: lipopolysaccharide heptosyltransferase II [Bryobacterales bacterium]|nr:lipopolysaccharide heptosyltransferase II [Bryobacterales bacterium]MBV9396565.1 lipopolysaccharide heptosyltransferase II [Bryobacterales bacterium]